uniref:HAT C-terminal dimerisation domain-containing protein n=1 Tax=Neolamprologus brichardi TaxID=32507 RepID=A0A3Q4GAH5_NEOBR
VLQIPISLFCRYLEYKAGSATSVIAVNPTQPQLSLFAPSIHLFSPNSPRQQAITQSILQDLIVGCSLPLSIVENPHFRHFLNVLDSKYTPVSRTTLTEKLIPHLVTKVTGITAHVACKNKDSYSLQSFLLDCRHFTGKHCGERIASAFDRIVEEYPEVEHPEGDNSDDLDDETMWEDAEGSDPWSTGERLSCFAHSLQLVISDGMKELKAIARAIAKASKFTNLLHSSSNHKDLFEAHFGSNKSIPAGNNTRWNSTYRQLKALTTLDHGAITEMCSDTENLVFSTREWAQLKDLCALLEPFSDATDLTEGDHQVTISMVVPTVLDLKNHLIKMEVQMPQVVTIVRALKRSLEKRFSGIFRQICMDEKDPEELFSHRIYFHATMLNPQFGLTWVDLDVQNGETGPALKRFRDDLKKSLIDTELSDSDHPQNNVFFHTTRHLSCNAAQARTRRFPSLHSVALKVLSVPASSAPVERIFSRGGILMRPHRARLGYKMLQSLVFLKCNQ